MMKLLSLIVVLFSFSSFAEIPAKPGFHFQLLDRVPVQSGGRIKPFDEFARETLLTITGGRSLSGMKPSEWVLSVLTQPEAWMKEPFLRVNNEDVRKQLLLPLDRKTFSFEELSTNTAFLGYLQSEATGSQVNDQGITVSQGKKDPRVEELKRVVDRFSRFEGLLQGRLWALSPQHDQEAPWGTLESGMKEPTEYSMLAFQVLKSYADGKSDEFTSGVQKFYQKYESDMPGFREVQPVIAAEVFYNRIAPFYTSMWFYFLAGLLWFLSDKKRFFRLMAKSTMFFAIALHVVGFGLRCYIAGRPPVTNMYESMIWVSFGVVIFSLVLYFKGQHRTLLSVSSFLAALGLMAADAAPLVMDPTIRPLVPVLRSNYWLTVHVLTITISYGAFMLAMGISNVTMFHFLKRAIHGDTAERVKKIEGLNQLSYRALMIGTVLLAAGTILGGIWADYSWGRFWGWDPKEVWALIALLVYMAILHARFTGWVGVFEFPLWTVIAFSTVVMAWYGVNFVLGAGLHSYGFSSGGQTVVATYLLVQTLWCVWIWVKWKRRRQA